LPALNGRVEGTVQAGSPYPIPGVSVRFRSSNPLFARTRLFTSDATASFQFQSAFSDSGSFAVPVGPFTLQGKHPNTDVEAPVANGTVAADTKLGFRDLVFSNTGNLKGAVRRSDGSVASLAEVTFNGSTLTRPFTLKTALDGTYVATGLLPGSYIANAVVSSIQGTPLTALGSSSVSVGEASTLDLVVSATGSVRGTVKRSSGETLNNLTVQLRGANYQRQTRTGSGGVFLFTDVPTGAAVLEAFEPGSVTGSSANINVAAGITINQDLTLLGAGQVAGTVIGPNNQPVANAGVTLISTAGTFQATSAANGRYEFNNVRAGNVTVIALDASSSLRGEARSSVGLAGSAILLNVQLAAAGSVQGTVYRTGGNIAAPSVQVSLRVNATGATQSVTTDLSGNYRFDVVPTGGFTLDAFDVLSGDRGSATNQVNSTGELRTVNFSLNGVGAVNVNVRRSNGQAVGAANVRLTSQTSFGGSQDRVTLGDGNASFSSVLAGGFSVSATDPVTGLAGSTTGSVTNGATQTVTVTLQPSVNLSGLVTLSDNSTPASGVTVRLLNQDSSVNRQTTTAANGSFRFDNLPLATYGLDALDSRSRVRARITGIAFNTAGEGLVRNLSFNGAASVSGRVLNPDATIAPGVPVTIRSLNALTGGTQSIATDNQGRYSFTEVPIGDFTVTAIDESRRLSGEANGTILQNNQPAALDIQLVDNLITLPVSRYDANNLHYAIQGNGSLLDSIYEVFDGDDVTRGGLLLKVTAGAVTADFTGGTQGGREENGREISVNQNNVAGLNITRKVYVPREGYFARYVEFLTNPTNAAINASLSLTSNLQTQASASAIYSTSSGDNVLSVASASTADRWFTTDDNRERDPVAINCGWFCSSGETPPVAFLFDGPGASSRVANASLTAKTGNWAEVKYGWENISIPANSTVAVMHFVAIQVNRAGARAAAERLEQLPPEALVGLSTSELTQIRNFVIPNGGVSALAPLPALTGSVTGAVYEYDGTTRTAATVVTGRSGNPLFARTSQLTTDGIYTLQGVLTDDGTSLAVPADSYQLFATHPLTGVAAPSTIASFDQGQLSAAKNIVFTNTGAVNGTISRAVGGAAAGATISISGTGLNGIKNVTSGLDGGFRFTGVPAGTLSLNASFPHPQGTALTTPAPVPVTIAAGAVTTSNLSIEPVGTVVGTVRNAAGQPTSGVTINFSRIGFTRSTTTGADGRYELGDLRLGVSTISAVDPATGVSSSAVVTVAANRSSTQDFSLIGSGTVQYTLTFANAAVAANVAVQITEAGRDGLTRNAGTTDGAGKLTISNVTVGTFTVLARHPSNTSLSVSSNGAIQTNGQSVSVSGVLPPTGTIQGNVTDSKGVAISSLTIRVTDPTFGERTGVTDSAGNYSVPFVPAGRPLRVWAYRPGSTYVYAEQLDRTVAADGQTLTVNLRMPGDTSKLRVTVLQENGQPNSGATVNIRDAYRGFFSFAGTTDAAGVFEASAIPEGLVRVYATKNGFQGSVSRVLTAAENDATVAISIQPVRTGVQGVISAGDGVTSISSARLSILDRVTGIQLNSGIAGTNGSYQFAPLLSGSEGLAVQASFVNNSGIAEASARQEAGPGGGTLTINVSVPVSVVKGKVLLDDGITPIPGAQVSLQTAAQAVLVTATSGSDGSFTFFRVLTPGQTYRVQATLLGVANALTFDAAPLTTVNNTDLKLPLGLVRGRVRFADGVAVPNPTISIVKPGSNLPVITGGSDGTYQAFLASTGQFNVNAQDPASGLQASPTANLGSLSETINLDINLQGDANLTGTIRDAQGAVVPNAQVTIVSTGRSDLNRFASANAQGVYQVSRIALGTVTARARAPIFNGEGNATIVLGTQSSTTTLDITIPPTGSIRGTVLGPQGNPLSGASLLISTSGLSRNVVSAGDGTYSVSNWPAGVVTVTIQSVNSGFATGTVVGNQELVLNITSGTSLNFNFSPFVYLLTSQDSFVYKLDTYGALDNSHWIPEPNGTLLTGIIYGPYLSIAGQYFSSSTATLGILGREINYTPVSLSGLQTSRSVYVPPQGGFVRYLDSFTNSTAFPVVAELKLEEYAGDQFLSLVPPTASANTYVVLSHTIYPSLHGHLYSSPAPPIPASVITDAFIATYTWQVTIPPGATRRILNYVFLRKNADAGQLLQSVLPAASLLADPALTVGLTTQQKSEIVNFRVP
jgi:hypothetical protein